MKKVVKDLVLLAVAVVIVLLAFKLGMKYELESTKQAVEDEIRLVQEHTAETVTDMFLNIPEVREGLAKTSGQIYTCQIHWWNFDRQYELTRFGDSYYNESWYELAR